MQKSGRVGKSSTKGYFFVYYETYVGQGVSHSCASKKVEWLPIFSHVSLMTLQLTFDGVGVALDFTIQIFNIRFLTILNARHVQCR